MNHARLISAPSDEPVDPEFIKLRLRVDGGEEDEFITSLIKSSREHVERRAGRALMSQTWQLVLDAFPEGPFELPNPPLQSVTSLSYIDVNGTPVTVAGSLYIVDLVSEPARLVATSSWPSPTLQAANGVIVEYVAGYVTADDVPEIYKQAMQVLIADGYENREGGFPSPAAERAVDALLGRELRGVR